MEFKQKLEAEMSTALEKDLAKKQNENETRGFVTTPAKKEWSPFLRLLFYSARFCDISDVGTESAKVIFPCTNLNDTFPLAEVIKNCSSKKDYPLIDSCKTELLDLIEKKRYTIYDIFEDNREANSNTSDTDFDKKDGGNLDKFTDGKRILVDLENLLIKANINLQLEKAKDQKPNKIKTELANYKKTYEERYKSNTTDFAHFASDFMHTEIVTYDGRESYFERFFSKEFLASQFVELDRNCDGHINCDEYVLFKSTMMKLNNSAQIIASNIALPSAWDIFYTSITSVMYLMVKNVKNQNRKTNADMDLVEDEVSNTRSNLKELQQIIQSVLAVSKFSTISFFKSSVLEPLATKSPVYARVIQKLLISESKTLVSQHRRSVTDYEEFILLPTCDQFAFRLLKISGLLEWMTNIVSKTNAYSLDITEALFQDRFAQAEEYKKYEIFPFIYSFYLCLEYIRKSIYSHQNYSKRQGVRFLDSHLKPKLEEKTIEYDHREAGELYRKVPFRDFLKQKVGNFKWNNSNIQDKKKHNKLLELRGSIPYEQAFNGTVQGVNGSTCKNFTQYLAENKYAIICDEFNQQKEKKKVEKVGFAKLKYCKNPQTGVGGYQIVETLSFNKKFNAILYERYFDNIFKPFVQANYQ